MNYNILRENDIRGTYPQDINNFIIYIKAMYYKSK